MLSMESKNSQEIERYDNYRKKRKRPLRLASCKAATILSMESSLNGEEKRGNIAASVSHGSISVIGRRRVMEDAVRVIPGFMAAKNNSGSYDFFAVYDGHGGTMVANACRDRLHLLLAKEVDKARASGENELNWHRVMCSCFMKMDEEIGGDETETKDDNMVRMAGNTMGSTAVVVMVGKEVLVVANCGDSRAVLCCGGGAIPLSRDHKPDRPDEKERVEAAGGRVVNWNGNRVLGVLATSRSIGDHCMKPFVISQPEVNVYPRTESDEFIVIASDGLWDVVTNSFACEVVRRCLDGQMGRIFKEGFTKGGTAEAAAALLAELAMSRGSKDNISVIVVQLKAST